MKEQELRELFERAVEVASQLQDQLDKLQRFNNKLVKSLKASEERETRERRAKLQSYAYILSTEQWKLFVKYSDQTSDTSPEVFHNIVVSRILQIVTKEETFN